MTRDELHAFMRDNYLALVNFAADGEPFWMGEQMFEVDGSRVVGVAADGSEVAVLIP